MELLHNQKSLFEGSFGPPPFPSCPFHKNCKVSFGWKDSAGSVAGMLKPELVWVCPKHRDFNSIQEYPLHVNPCWALLLAPFSPVQAAARQEAQAVEGAVMLRDSAWVMLQQHTKSPVLLMETREAALTPHVPVLVHGPALLECSWPSSPC